LYILYGRVQSTWSEIVVLVFLLCLQSVAATSAVLLSHFDHLVSENERKAQIGRYDVRSEERC